MNGFHVTKGKDAPFAKGTILDRYDDFCARQKGKEFLWYSILFISLIGSIMPLSLIAMSFTPWFYPYIFVCMLLFFSNIVGVIGRANIRFIISFYLFTVAVNILVPILSFSLLAVIG